MARKMIDATKLIERLEVVGELTQTIRAFIGEQRGEKLWRVYVVMGDGRALSQVPGRYRTDELIVCAPNAAEAKKEYSKLVPTFDFHGHEEMTESLMGCGNTYGPKLVAKHIDKLTNHVLASTRCWDEERAKAWY